MRTARAKAREKRPDNLRVLEGEGSKYRVIFEQATDAIATFSEDGTIDAVNQAAEDLTGFLKSELVGKSISMLVPSDQARIPERARALSSHAIAHAGIYEDVAIQRKDGYVRLVDLSVRLVERGKRTLTLALFRDMTEKKKMERELITKHAELRKLCFELERNNAELKSMQETLVQAGKMAALGELAAGIAHELNQPLQGIRGYAQELQAVHGEDAHLKEIVSNADKMAGIISYLRTFTRKSTEQHELTDIHRAIEEALKMLSRQFAARGIEVTRDFAPGLPPIYANPLQLEQVFINLATNARDAIEATGRGSGRLEIKTQVSASGKGGGTFVEVVFRDDGIGMNERTKSKIFNPFFTTKDVGRGMGLGLSISYGILSKLHGSILVESALGKGTAFTIRLPQDFRELA